MRIVNYTICQIKNFFNSLIWILQKLRIENFKNYIEFSEKNKKLVILANGPSLRESISKDIQNYQFVDTCVVNFFCKSPYFKEIKPRYYVLADPLFFIKDTPDCQVYEIFNRIEWKMSLYVPFEHYTFAKNMILNELVSVFPYHSIPYNGWKSLNKYIYKKGWSMPRPQNVLIPSIFIGINLGYKEIDIYGADHSWTKQIVVNEDNQVCQSDKHFYDESIPELIPWNKCDGSPYKMQEILRDLAWMFDSYHVLREYADYIGTEIFNCTPNSYIDAFERR